jgi:hypothetical protein
MIDGHEFLSCAYCGDRIGVYEPIVVVRDGRRTALAREPELRRQSRSEVIHERCAQAASADLTAERVTE